MQEYLANPLVQGVLTGILTAAAVDIAAFRSWKSFDEALTYGWKLAAFRWFQGAVVGLLASLGLGGLS